MFVGRLLNVHAQELLEIETASNCLNGELLWRNNRSYSEELLSGILSLKSCGTAPLYHSLKRTEICAAEQLV